MRLSLSALVVLAGALAAPAFAASKRYESLAVRLVGQAEAALTAKKPDPDRADALANLALTANPANAAAYIVKAQAQDAKGDSEQSLRLVTVGLDIEPSNIAALGFQGAVALKLDNFKQAELTLQKLQTLCGDKCPETGKLEIALRDARASAAKSKKSGK